MIRNKMKLSCKSYVKLNVLEPFMKLLPNCFRKRILNDREKAYFKAVKRLEKETNIVTIIRGIREMRKASKFLLTPE